MEIIFRSVAKRRDKQALVLLKLASELTSDGWVDDSIQEAIKYLKEVIKKYE